MNKNIPENHELEVIVSSLVGEHGLKNGDDLMHWLSQNPENINIYNQYKQIINVSKGGEDRFDSVKSFNKVDSILLKEKKSKIQLFIHYFSRVAAAILILFISIWGYTGFNSHESKLVVSVETAFGNRTKTVLPDGTAINLNSASHVDFYIDKNNRQILLNGEAFFKVSKSKKPFVVKTKKQTIKVYGTEFNVEAYNDDDFIKTTLREGSISVVIEGNKDTKEFMLKPGQQAVYLVKEEKLVITKCDVNRNIAWIDNRMLLRSVSFYDISKKLNRRYKSEIIFSNDQLKNYHFSGSFKDETVDDIIQTLCRISKSKYKKSGTNYFIY